MERALHHGLVKRSPGDDEASYALGAISRASASRPHTRWLADRGRALAADVIEPVAYGSLSVG
jgi:hypothetical protein